MRSRFIIALWLASFCVLGIAAAQSPAADEGKANSPSGEPKKTPPSASTESPIAGLPEGWKKEIEIPEWRNENTGRVYQAASKLKLWVEQGWLVARYERPERGLEWQAVLAQAKESKQPDVRIDNMPRGFELTYGPYFIREHNGWLSVFRERKTNDSPQWPSVPLPKTAKWSSAGRSHGEWDDGDWRWIGFGFDNNPTSQDPRDYHYDIWTRVQHKALPPVSGSFRDGMESNHYALDAYYHDYTFHDEGDVFFGRRSTDTEDQVRAKLANILNGRPAPELTVKRWFNEPSEASFKKLQGKVVLLYFWNADDYSALAARLERKYKDRGLVVLGVHPAMDSEKLDELLKEKNIDLPTAIDTARTDTERAYTVKIWPTYFLIDKSGKVSQGYLDHPPTDKQVEALLQ